MPEALTIEGLKTRPQYLAVARTGIKTAKPGLVVQYLPPAKTAQAVKVGLTVSGKTGGAVIRNRIKRRLRSVINEILPTVANPGGTYVIIGRRAALERPFEDLKDDLRAAVKSVHQIQKSKAGK